MKTNTDLILILTTEELSSEITRRLKDSYPNPIAVLDLGFSQNEWMPDEWTRINPSELLDINLLRQEFLGFLDDWPKNKFSDQRSFDETFHDENGYSLWWLGPGRKRHPDNEPFTKLKSLWLGAKAIEKFTPQKILIFTKDPRFAAILKSKCQNMNTEYQFIETSAQPASLIWKSSLLWLILSLLEIIVLPALLAIRKICARLLAGTYAQNKNEKEKPAIVLTSSFPRHIRIENNEPKNWYWKEIEDELKKSNPELRHVYTFYTGTIGIGRFRGNSWFHHSAWVLLKKMNHLFTLEQSFTSVLFSISRIPSQLKSLIKYYLLEHNENFRNSFIFAGADVSVLYIPLLRESVQRKALWETYVDAICNALREIGNVKAIMVCEEMYKIGMRFIAAAKKLSIPSIGVQHGNIFPMHLIYNIPKGHFEKAPVCDYFAAYGEFAKKTLSTCGNYPQERIWSTGAGRLDHLVNNPPDKTKSRLALNLDLEKQIVLVTTQLYSWFIPAAETIFETLCDRNDALVCIKMHPRDKTLSEYQAIAKKIGLKNVHFFTDHFEELLAACDILVSSTSTTMLEAALLNKKIISINFSEEPDRYPFTEDTNSLPAHSKNELKAALAIIFDSDMDQTKHQDFLRYHLGPTTEGIAAKTLANKINDLISAK